MYESEYQLKKFLIDIEKKEILEEGYFLSIMEETNINFLFIKQELDYLRYLYKTLGYYYKYYLPSNMD